MHSRPARSLYVIVLAVVFSLGALSCGAGGGGGAGPDGAGQGLVLLSFLQNGQDNAAINRSLEFRFSEAVRESTINDASIQIRTGPAFGLTADGEFVVDGANVIFRPRLPGECGYADAGFEPGTTYRVTLLGNPEAFAILNSQGQPLESTITREFSTLPDSNPEFLADQIPGAAPRVDESTPAAGSAAVRIDDTTAISVVLSENVDPCTLVANSTVRLSVYEVGDAGLFLDAPSGGSSGFNPIEDSLPNNPYSWGGNATALPSPTLLPAALELDQTEVKTTLLVRPQSGLLPDNCLIVLELSNGIRDFGGTPFVPEAISFTTENLLASESSLTIEYDDTTPIDGGGTTADVNTARSPSRAQGWISYGGDGDNGPFPDNIPSFPTLSTADFSVLSCTTRENDGVKDDFAPTANVTLQTGSTRIDDTCTNTSDGSQAAVFEFANFHIPSGVTVTIEGENPAIILVNGNATIDSGGVLRVRGSNGGTGISGCTPGGAAGAGGPGGGSGAVGGYQHLQPTAWAPDGESGYGSPTPFDAPGLGGGEGGVAAYDPPGWAGSGVGGGGGGHALEGTAGQAQLSGTGQFSWAASPVRGGGGGVYPSSDSMQTPSCGSGGGGGGCDMWNSSWQTSSCDTTTATGGGGGGGGGFVCITANGDIRVNGTILAVGGSGGGGGSYSYCGGAGGGGGSGGGIRLLTPGSIDVTAGTLTTSGGSGGAGSKGNYTGTTNLPHYANNGGAGSHGRIVLEDEDGVIAGMSSATVLPNEGDEGFYRSSLDTTRFVEGGTESTATTQPIVLGSIINVAGVEFAQLRDDDFVVGVPSNVNAVFGSTSIVVEMQGYLSTLDGEVDESSATGWYTVGYFSDSGNPNAPTWHPDAAPADFTPDAGVGIDMLDGRAAHVQVRLYLFLVDGSPPDQAGPFVDSMRIRFAADN